MSTSPRSERVAGLLRRELADLLHSEFEYEIPRGLISVTDVEVSRDISHAKIFVAVLEVEQAPEIVEFLNEHAGQVRHQLGKRVHLRHTPTLKFVHDISSETGDRIEQLLASAKKKG